MNKKAQQLVFGTMIMLFVFFLAFTLFFDEIFTNKRLYEERYDSISAEAKRAANALIMPGYPEGWDEDDVQRAGIVDQGIINWTKTNSLETYVQRPEGYQGSKELLGIRHDYLLTINDQGATMRSITGPGMPSTKQALEALAPAYLAAATRTATEPGTGRPLTITIYVYRQPR